MTTFVAPVNFNYSTLVQIIQDWMQQNSPGFNGQVATFIGLAEQDLAIQIKNLGQLENANWTGISQTIPKPVNWRQTKSIQVINQALGISTFLLERTYEYCQQFETETTDAYMATIGRLPQWYSDYGWDYILISPYNSATAANTILKLAYFATPAPLSTTNENNWWTINCPQALLFASLYNAAVYLRMPEREQEFMSKLQQIVSAINAENNNYVNDQSYSVKPALQSQNLG